KDEISEEEIASLRAELKDAENAVQARRGAVDESEQELAALEARVEALRAELKSLEEKRASVLASIAARSASLATARTANEALAGAVEQNREEVRNLQNRLAVLTAGHGRLKQQPGMTAAFVPGRLPAPVDLNGNRIAPVTKDFFHFPLLSLSVITLVH